MNQTLKDIIREALENPGTVTHVDIVHEKYCDGKPCNCEPDYQKRRTN